MDYRTLSHHDQDLLQQAIDAANRLYIHGIQEVAAALRTTTGLVFTAIHFETATGFATVCGELAALCCMVAAGHRDVEIIVAVWRDPQGHHFVVPPCGRCREVLSDFNPAAQVIVTTLPNHWDVAAIDHLAKVSIADLLPLKSHHLQAGTTR